MCKMGLTVTGVSWTLGVHIGASEVSQTLTLTFGYMCTVDTLGLTFAVCV